MPMKLRMIAAIVGAAALLGGVGVDVARAGTYPKDGTYHDGGTGATVEPSPDPTTLATASFSPQDRARVACGAVPWGTC
ncbi:hypothetical protein JDV09_05300 [Mycobacterium sp. Y57]|uniref:hypothetical protein n=1 Tax=Mycolicibacterium xanthum TaxID=2796469 RepID=UPI001C849C44|nr:hypothetical protein [Mycolicibacterium xanthum]MBX7431526.1 hypothetical protein [Mycolicibacterium xanthum]